ncbi:MAG: IS110 family transposase [Candidatus Paceibacterota bacterium]
MKFKEAIGIDVSKDTLDACFHSFNSYRVVENTTKGFRSLILWVEKQAPCTMDQIIFCFEHTGIYSSMLAKYLSEKRINYVIVPGLEIKRSLGIQRGKSDIVDAEKIALYAYHRKDDITTYQMPETSIYKLKELLSLREKLVKQRAGYQATLKEQKRFLKKLENPLLFTIPEKLIKELKKQVDKIELEIDAIIYNNSKMKSLYELIISINGVGRQTALHLIVITNGFLLFDNPRKLASYVGIAPFPYRSGTSIKGRSKVSNLANKKLKSLLNTCAISAISYDPEIKLYYKRKIADGKSKMSTVNAVRNKIVHRIFAVVKRGTPYVSTHDYAA